MQLFVFIALQSTVNHDSFFLYTLFKILIFLFYSNIIATSCKNNNLNLIIYGDNLLWAFRRSVQINLSDDGQLIFAQIENDMNIIFDEVLGFIEPTKQDAFLYSISLYNQAIEKWKETKQHE